MPMLCITLPTTTPSDVSTSICGWIASRKLICTAPVSTGPIEPGLFLVVGLLTYVLQVVALLAVFASFRRGQGWTEQVSGRSLGLTVIVCTAIWTVGLVVASHFSRVPLYDASGRM